ncbi:MAG: helix-turn-helix transcriptional regulator [Alphaproteobacteria bacterium]|nr:helix-turn-helix transcriptional regulator [Alphaproteobacteria bacterium]MDD9919996.1 helix-turn-helix transcriptional regulator [Alphaproteobacteria bacterium]
MKPRSPIIQVTFFMDMPKKSLHLIDIHVGQRLKQLRIMLGLSQEKLATKLNITYQQVQKYENATNRISASKLYEAAQILHVSVQFFYEGVEVELE